MAPITQPCSTVVQLSTVDPDVKPILSVLCKRTYKVLPYGECAVADEQLPLVKDFQPDPDNSRRLDHDSDLYPWKLMTDIVVRGHAYGDGRCSFMTSVQVGQYKKQVAVIGDRRCFMGNNDRILFSEPLPVEKIPLRYDRAYGGMDVVAQETKDNPTASFQKYLDPAIDISLSSPYIYPRNFAGVGYLIEATPDAVERLKLPNLEDPLDYLTPNRLVVGSPGRWPAMPLPQAFDWVDPGTFPRLAYMGIVHDHESLASPPAEIVRGFAPGTILTQQPLEKMLSHRFANGASLGLQVPYLQGGERCLLVNVHPHRQSWVFSLPVDQPVIQTDGRNGTMKETEPVIHTVEIEPDESRLSIVWRGAAPALRPYLPKELEKMPLVVQWN
jgi:hypothetical protein